MDEKLTEKEIREKLNFADESCGHDELKASYEAIREGFKEFREEISDYWEATKDIETDSTFLSDLDRKLERLSDEDIADIIKESLEKIESWFDFVRTSR